MELFSAVSFSTLSTYFSQLRVFARWCADPLNPIAIRRESVEHVLFDIAKNQIPWSHIRSYVHTRTYDVHFRTVRASLSALSFFFRHLAHKSIWEIYPDLKQCVKSLQKRFLKTEGSGSIALTFDQFKDLAEFVLNDYYHPKISSAVLYNLLILGFWAMLRISEACRLCFTHIAEYVDPTSGLKKIRLTLLHPKTATTEFPNQFVVLAELKGNPYCPIQAYERLKLFATEGQNPLFVCNQSSPIGTSFLNKVFGDLISAWQHSSPKAPSGRITFHTLRISSIGFQVIELGLSIFEVQTFSRHKFGSEVTQQIYLARNKQHLLEAAANKITKLVPFVGSSDALSHAPSWMENMPISTQHIFRHWFKKKH